MNPIVFHIVSGDAYCSGFFLILIAIWSSFLEKRIFRRLSFASLMIGLVFVLLTAVPSTLWEVSLLFVILILTGMSILQSLNRRTHSINTEVTQSSEQRFSFQRVTRISVTVLIALAVMVELIWRIPPRFETRTPSTLTIFADSITAGMGEKEAITWPQLIEEQQDLHVVDYSRMGATVGSQLKWLHTHEVPDGLIFIELGGNDMFSGTTAKDFHRDLDQLLKQLCKNSQPVVMFELPIPPTFNRFGISQRQLARKYQVQLISKRIFAQVLADKDATLDTIHLSQAGHEIMAKVVWQQVQTAFGD